METGFGHPPTGVDFDTLVQLGSLQIARRFRNVIAEEPQIISHSCPLLIALLAPSTDARSP